MPHDTYREEAILENPFGAVCGSCGKENQMVDDLGWFYGWSKVRNMEVPLCLICLIATGWRPGER